MPASSTPQIGSSLLDVDLHRRYSMMKALRRLQRAAQREAAREDIIHEVSHEVKCKAVLLARRSDSSDVVLRWIARQQWHTWRRCGGVARVIRAADVARWDVELADDPKLRAIEEDPEHRWHDEITTILIESLVVDDVARETARGALVPPRFILLGYLRKWRYLTPSASVQAHLLQLEGSATKAKNWARLFRERWDLRWTTSPVPHCLTEDALRHRCAVLLRWARWVSLEVANGREIVWVNMDESTLSNVKAWKKGIRSQREPITAEGFQNAMRLRALPRTSLIAAIASSPEVQRVLPQVRLPRSVNGKKPTFALRAAYATAQRPQVTWHGTNGWNTQTTMLLWLTALRRAVRSVRPSSAIVLLMDCCSVHLSSRTWARMVALQIIPIIVPARTTWLLQPLDVYCFAGLKRKIRNEVFRRSSSGVTGTLSQVEQACIHGEAIKTEIIDRDWSRSFKDFGFLGDETVARSKVAELVAGCDLTPRLPDVPELMECLSVNARRSRELLTSLESLARTFQTNTYSAAAGAESAVAVAERGLAEGGVPRCAAAVSADVPLLVPLPAAPRAVQTAANLWLQLPQRTRRGRSSAEPLLTG